MASEAKYNTIVGHLRSVLAAWYKPGEKAYDGIVGARDEVFEHYQQIFSPTRIPSLTREDFTSFLNDKNNRHWSSLQRSGKRAASDMDKLRAALAVLLDENRPIRERFPEALDMVKGLGTAIATAILTVAYPDKYGVWNNTSAAALQQENLWPNFERGESDGGRYEKINTLLLRLSSDLKIDLWTLDGLLWFLRGVDVEARDLTDEELEKTIRDGRLRFPDEVETSTTVAQTRQRRGQEKVRQVTLENYGFKCAVCDVAVPDLLIASHVIGWAERAETRGDLKNTLCLCRFHDALFENGYWSLTDDLRVDRRLTVQPFGLYYPGLARFVGQLSTHPQLSMSDTIGHATDYEVTAAQDPKCDAHDCRRLP